MEKNNPWLDVTADLPIDVKAGQVLLYDFEGSPIHLKIMRVARGKVWAKYTHLYTEEEMKREVRVIDLKTGKKNRAIRTKKD